MPFLGDAVRGRGRRCRTQDPANATQRRIVLTMAVRSLRLSLLARWTRRNRLGAAGDQPHPHIAPVRNWEDAGANEGLDQTRGAGV